MTVRCEKYAVKFSHFINVYNSCIFMSMIKFVILEIETTFF